MTGCLQRICCFLRKQEEKDERPDIFVVNSQIDKDSIPDTDSGVHSKLNKLGINGSVSEEDSGVGSEGKESDIAEQTDTSSHVDSESIKPGSIQRCDSKMSKDNFSDFELNLNNNETDLTAEIAQQLKQMNGFSLEGNSSKTILDCNGDGGDQAEKKKKRKRRKHRKQNNIPSQETSEDQAEDVKEV